MPAWPVDPADLGIKDLREAILARAAAVKDGLVAQYQPDWAFRQGINAFWALKRRTWVERLAVQPILADLANKGLITSS